MNALLQDPSTKWLADLLNEIDQFDGSLFPPPYEKCDRDTVVGDCPEALQKFFSFARFCEREQKTIQMSMQYDANVDQTEAAYTMGAWKQKHDIAMELFFALLLQTYVHQSADFMKQNIGVRKGWVVVFSKPPRPRIQFMPFPGMDDDE